MTTMMTMTTMTNNNENDNNYDTTMIMTKIMKQE